MERAPRDRRSLDILSVKKEAKLSPSEVNNMEVGRGDANLRQSNSETTGIVRNREAKIRVALLFGRNNKVVVAVTKRLKR